MYFLLTSNHIEMHLLEGPDLEHSMIYYDRKLEGEIEEKEKKPWAQRDLNPRPNDHKAMLYHCATTAALPSAKVNRKFNSLYCN